MYFFMFDFYRARKTIPQQQLQLIQNEGLTVTEERP